MSSEKGQYNLHTIIIAGACAGLSVDVLLFPIDTIKTRLQSAPGFFKSGGFKNIYAGLNSVIIGSSPGAAVFFLTYETVKSVLLPKLNEHYYPLVHMFSASLGEIMSCVVRVPTEVIKQRAQTSHTISSWMIFKKTLHSEGLKGFYRGYFTTVLREIPFSLIEFPIWEQLKYIVSQKQGSSVTPWQSALCGGISGGIAAALTTPIDVAKTRIMLSDKRRKTTGSIIFSTLSEVWKTNGTKGLFAGLLPRVTWISVGGVIFFGAYETVLKYLSNVKRNI